MNGTHNGLDENEDLGLLIMEAMRLMRADFGNRTRHVPLTLDVHSALMLLYRHPGCRQTLLARWLDVAPATVIRMLARLEKQELVRRETDPDDRRTVRIYLAPKATPSMG